MLLTKPSGEKRPVDSAISKVSRAKVPSPRISSGIFSRSSGLVAVCEVIGGLLIGD